MRVRIVVADQAKVRFYDAEHYAAEFQLAGELSDPAAHLHNRDLVSDRPGRKSDRTPLQSGRRGAVAHHGVGSDRKPRKHEAVLFAPQIVGELISAQRAERFDRLVLIAPPEFLGVLRKTLPVALHKMVAAEVAKDLVHESPAAVRSYVPAQSFQIMAGPQRILRLAQDYLRTVHRCRYQGARRREARQIAESRHGDQSPKG